MGLVRRSCLGSLLIPVLTVLVAVGVLGLAVDRGAAWVVGNSVESRLADDGAVGASVTFHGFPFLDQLLHRDFSSVEVRAVSVARDGLIGRDVRVRLHGVRPDGTDAVLVERAQGALTVPFDEIERVTGLPAGSLSADGAEIVVRRTATVLGRTVTFTGTATVRVVGDRVVVSPQRVRVGAVVSTGSLLRTGRALLRLSYPLEGLPDGLRVTTVRPAPDGLVVDLAGTNARLTG